MYRAFSLVRIPEMHWRIRLPATIIARTIVSVGPLPASPLPERPGPMKRLTLATAIALSVGLASTARSESQGLIIEERPLSPSSAGQVVPASPQAVAAPVSAPPATAPSTPVENNEEAGTSASVETWKIMQSLQEEVRNLRGKLEEQEYAINRLREDLRVRYTDLDQRVVNLGERMEKQQASAAAEKAAPPVTIPAVSAPVETVNIEEEKNAYLAAYDVFRNQGPDKAIPRMLAFTTKYPKSTFAPNAHYWLGEFYLNAKTADTANARKHFGLVLQNSPDHAKAPAALYKIAMMLDVENKPAEARIKLEELLKRYPSSPEAALAQSWIEQQKKAGPVGKTKTGDSTPAVKTRTASTPDKLDEKDRKFVNNVKDALQEMDPKKAPATTGKKH